MTDAGLDLDQIRAVTLASYQQRAEAFWAGTRDHDVSQNLQAMFGAIAAPTPWTILDFGCGPGRDLIALAALGHTAIGLDGTPAFCEMARANSGCVVWQQDFMALQLPDRHFDGIFANATLQHIPQQELPRVLGQLRQALRPDGVLFASSPRGDDTQGWNGDRFGAYRSLQGLTAQLTAAGFVLVDHYYRPVGLPFDQQNWLATVARRVGP